MTGAVHRGGARATLVMAVDGLLVPTLAARATVLHEAARAVGLPLGTQREPAWYAGRDWAEMARLLVARDANETLIDPVASDAHETLIDLVALLAERRWGERLRAGLPTTDAAAMARAQAAVLAGQRVILRADTTRRAGAMLFELLVTATACSRLVAGDDVPGVGVAGEHGLRRRQYGALGVAGSWQLEEVHEGGIQPP
jgi:hypothetical protein